MAAIKFDTTGDNSNVLESFKGVQDGVRKMQGVVEESGHSIEDMFKRVASAAGIAFSVSQAKGFVDKVKEVRSFFQDIESSMTVFLGNQQKASEFTDKLKDYAFYNMFEFKDLAAASQQMIAYGNSVNDIIPILDKLSNVASGTGADLMDLVGLYNKAKSTGTVGAQALYSWATKGVVVKDVLKEMGEEVDGTAITFDQLNKVLNKLTSEGGMFHDLMLSQMENLSAEEGQLADELDAMYNEIGEKYQDFLKGTIDTQIWLVEHYKEIGSVIMTLVATYGLYKAALVATRAVERAEQNYRYSKEAELLQQEIDAAKQLLPAKEAIKNADIAEAVAKKQLTEEQAKAILQKREELELAKQTSKSNEMKSAIDAQIASLQQLLPAKEANKNADIEALVASGQLSAEMANEIISKRETLEATLELVEARKANIESQLAEAQASLATFQTEQQMAQNRKEEAERTTEYYRERLEAALELGDAESIESAENAYNTAISNENAAAKELQAAMTATATAQEQVNTLAEEQNTIQKALNTSATESETVAEVANSAATAGNTTAVTTNTLAQKLNAIQTRANAMAQAVLAAAINSVKNAWNAMKVAMMTNPIGAIIGGLSLAIGLFSSFISSSEDAKEASVKFGESADKAARDVESLYAILQNSSTESKVHKDALAELKQIADEYGLTLNNEISLEDQLIQKKKELIGLLREEAIERQKANDISTLTDTLKDEIDELRKDLVDDIDDAFSDVEKNQIANLIDDEQVDRIVSKMRAYKEAIAKASETMGNNAHLARESRDAYSEYQSEIDKVMNSVQAYGTALGKEQDDINATKNEVESYMRQLVLLRLEYDNTVEATNYAARAAQLAEEANDGMTESQRISAIQTKNTKKSVDDLYASVQQLLRDYSNNTLNFSVSLDTSEVPDWMKKELGMNGNGTGNIDLAKEQAAYYSAQLEYSNSHPAWQPSENGLSRDENAQRAAWYTKAARDIQQEKDSWEKSRAEREKEAKKKAQEAKKAEQERLKRLKELEKYRETMAKLALDRQRAAEDLEFSTAQAEIEAMDDGNEKVIAQLGLDFRKRKEEIEREYEDLKQKKIEQARQLWEANPANKDKIFDTSNVDTSYTEEEKANYQAQLNANRVQYERSLEEQRKSENQYMYDFLREYGSMQEKRKAINDEYNQKIEDANNEWQRASLEAERKKMLSDLDLEALQGSINWELIFNDLDSLSVEYLGKIKEQLKTALDAKDITAENAKVIAEKIREIEESINERTDFLSAILPGLNERKRLTQEAATAELEWRKALEQTVPLMNRVLNDKKEIQSKLNLFGIQVELEQISESSKENLLASLEPNSELYNQLKEMFEKLATDTANLNAGQQTVQNKKSQMETLNDILKGKGALTDIFSFSKGGPVQIINGINDNVQSLNGLVEKFGLGETDFGQAVQGFADGVGGFNNAIQSLLSGDIFGAISGVFDGIAGFGRMGINALIGGGNEEEMEREIEKLSIANDALASSIDKLANKITSSDSTNTKSIEAYKKAYESEKEWEENQRKKINARASEYANSGYGFLGLGGKSSFNAHMKGNEWAGWKEFTQILKDNGYNTTVNRSNIWTLSPEEMELLKEFAPKRWSELFSGDGHRNPEDLVNEYIERAGKLEELTSALNEKLTGYTWDGFLDSYKSLLKDLTSDTEDFGEKMEEIISNALLESLVNEEFAERIKKLYQYIADHAGDGLDESELAYIRNENENIANEMIARRQNLIDAGLLKPTDDEYRQEASSKGFQAMSQDTGEELNGRFTALQIAGETISSQIIVAVATLNGIAAFSQSSNTAVLEIRNMMIMTNSYLEDMVKYAKLLYTDFGEKLDSIIKNTDNL